MVQAADMRNGSYLPSLRRLDFAWHRGIAVQRQMSTAVVIVIEVRRKDAF